MVFMKNNIQMNINYSKHVVPFYKVMFAQDYFILTHNIHNISLKKKTTYIICCERNRTFKKLTHFQCKRVKPKNK